MKTIDFSKLPWVAVSVFALSCLFMLLGEAFFSWSVWQTRLWSEGEWWRFLTGHLSHASWEHFIWDAGAWLILAGFVERRSRRALIWVTLLGVVMSEIALRVSGRFALYCGLSGLDMALFFWAAAVVFREGCRAGDRWMAAVSGLGLLLACLKIGYELIVADPAFVGGLGRGFQVAVEGHVAGALAGLAVAAFHRGAVARGGSREVFA